MNLASSIDSDLIARSDAKTRVIPGAKIHDALAGSRVGLFVKGALYGKASRDAGLEQINVRHWALVDIRRGGIVP